MSWSLFSQLLPLLVLLTIVGAVGWVGYQIYITSTKIQEEASQKMGKKNVVFSKDGVRVGVKHVENERYVDATQSWVVKAWNLHDSNVKAAGAGTVDSKKKKK